MSRSTRWCPTPEQLMILEELYRGGLRTPKAYQIQKITAHLSLYGKIEGKNVFYWFQNHKARDRQKLRRKLTKQLEHQQLLQQQLYQHQHHNLENPLHHHLDSYPSTVLHQQLPCYNSVGCLPQGRVEDASPRLGDYIWKVNIPRSCEMENHSMIRTYGHDWMMMMMDVSPAISSCTTSRRPLETLSLFPTTATSLKDQSTANEP